MAIIKFFLAIVLLPIVYASAVSLNTHLMNLPSTHDEIFLWGLGIFLLTYIFVYQFDSIYEYGQKISQGAFKMFAPFDRFIANLFPFYPIVLCILFFLYKNFLKLSRYDEWFLFFIGFSMAMHILLTTQTLQEEEKGAVKPTYLLSISLIFIINVFMLVFSLDIIYLNVTFPDFFNLMYKQVVDVFVSIFGIVSQ